MRILLYIVVLTCWWLPAEAQPFVEVIEGDYPVILSAPHGGYVEPDSLKDRSCPACVLVRDARTQEWTRLLLDEVRDLTGRSPYAVINLLARTKLDPNREVGEAADGDPVAEQAWADYHRALEEASQLVETEFGAGLLLDLHGQSHAIPRVELGYLLPASVLREPNLDGRADQVSTAALASRVGSVETLLRGPASFGALLDGQGYPSVPSPSDPAPNPGEDYFSGGYITLRHGSRAGGTIDAIQVEAFRVGARDSDEAVAALARATAAAVVFFVDAWYAGGTTSSERSALCADPERGSGYVRWDGACRRGPAVLFDVLGRRVRLTRGDSISTEGLAAGLYYLRTGDGRAWPVRVSR